MYFIYIYKQRDPKTGWPDRDKNFKGADHVVFPASPFFSRIDRHINKRNLTLNITTYPTTLTNKPTLKYTC